MNVLPMVHHSHNVSLLKLIRYMRFLYVQFVSTFFPSTGINSLSTRVSLTFFFLSFLDHRGAFHKRQLTFIS